MRHSRRIAAAAAGLYAVALAVAWTGGGVWMDRKSEALLRSARADFTERLEGVIHATQWYQANLVLDQLGGWTNAVPRSVSEMRAVAERLYIDELNLVSSNGIVIASNIPKVIGDDWRRHPKTAEFLEMLAPDTEVGRMVQPRMSQPFRHGTVNPEYYCTYFAVALADRSGIVQLGFAIDRLVAAMAYSDAKIIGGWRIGRHGHFAAIDRDGDGSPDDLSRGADEASMEHGVLDRVVDDGEDACRLTFAFAGHLFAAIVPDREFGGQRLLGFAVFALTSALLILVFSVVLVRLSLARRKLEALHREAADRAAADLAVARKIQLSSLPGVAAFEPDAIAFSLAATTRPAREVGGDFYDFFRVSDGRLALVVADVSGKGISAALFMHEAKHAFVEALRAEGGLAAAVTRMNGELCAHNEAEMFVTGWFGLLDTATGVLEYVNAGHNRPYLLPADDAPVRLAERGGRFIGTFPEATYRVTRRQLAPGDRIVLFTDGVTEAMDAASRAFGEKRFEALLATHPADVVAATVDAVEAHVAGAERSDDLTMLVAAWYGEPESVLRSFAVDSETAGACVAFLRETVTLADRKAKARLVNAADELVANVVSYSGAKTLAVGVSVSRGRCRVVLADDGTAYNPLAHRDPDTHAALEERPEGGLGILMAKRLVSSVTWSRDGACNRTVLVQRG